MGFKNNLVRIQKLSQISLLLTLVCWNKNSATVAAFTCRQLIWAFQFHHIHRLYEIGISAGYAVANAKLCGKNIMLCWTSTR